MAGLGPAIHVFFADPKPWMPGTRPGMTLLLKSGKRLGSLPQKGEGRGGSSALIPTRLGRHSGEGQDLLDREMARHDGDGNREGAGKPAARERRDEWAGSRGVLGGAEHEDADIPVLLD